MRRQREVVLRFAGSAEGLEIGDFHAGGDLIGRIVGMLKRVFEKS